MSQLFFRRRTEASANAPFPYPSPLTKQLLKRVISLSQQSFTRGWNPGTGGNFSVLGPQGVAWVSASGKHKGQLEPRDFLPVHVAESTVVAPNYRKASDETALHCAIYRADSSARVCLHVHPPHTVALVQQPLVLAGNEMLKVFGLPTHDAQIVIPAIVNTQDMQLLGTQIGPQLDQQLKVLVLIGHGVYAWGASPDEAMYRLEALEYLCQLQSLMPIISSPSA